MSQRYTWGKQNVIKKNKPQKSKHDTMNEILTSFFVAYVLKSQLLWQDKDTLISYFLWSNLRQNNVFVKYFYLLDVFKNCPKWYLNLCGKGVYQIFYLIYNRESTWLHKSSWILLVNGIYQNSESMLNFSEIQRTYFHNKRWYV